MEFFLFFVFSNGDFKFYNKCSKIFNWVDCLFVCLNFSRLSSKDVLLGGGGGREEGRELRKM